MSGEGDTVVRVCPRCGLHFTESRMHPPNKHWGFCPRCGHREPPKF